MRREDVLKDEYNPYYEQYILKSDNATILEGLKVNGDKIVAFLEAISQDKLEYRYEDGKWTIKEVIQHLIDTERIFTYRALCIAREDKSLFPGFDQDDYVVSSKANSRSINDLLKEYKILRSSTVQMFESFSADMLRCKGIASNSSLTPRAVAFIIMGHENHHCEVVRERYL